MEQRSPRETLTQSEKFRANGPDAEKTCGTPVLNEHECKKV